MLPVHLSVSAWTEPDYSREDKQHGTPTMMPASVTVMELTVGKIYSLLRFEDPEHVPTSDFLRAQWSRKDDFVAAGPNYTLATQFMSNSTVLFRCVQSAHRD